LGGGPRYSKDAIRCEYRIYGELANWRTGELANRQTGKPANRQTGKPANRQTGKPARRSAGIAGSRAIVPIGCAALCCALHSMFYRRAGAAQSKKRRTG
jgi:hypothetical protein